MLPMTYIERESTSHAEQTSYTFNVGIDVWRVMHNMVTDGKDTVRYDRVIAQSQCLTANGDRCS